jgi:hypothetical protein
MNAQPPRVPLALLAAVLSTLFVGGCVDWSYESDDADIDARVLVVDDLIAGELTVEDARLILPAAGNDALRARSPGDVLVSGERGGFIRIVDAIRQEGSLLVIDTHDGTLEDVVAAGGTGDVLAVGTTTYKDDGFTFSNGIDYSFGTRTLLSVNQLTVKTQTGRLSLKPSLDWNLDIRDRQLRNFRAVASGTIEASVALTASIDGALQRQFSVPVYQTPPTFYALTIGPVPVVVSVSTMLVAQGEIGTSGKAYIELRPTVRGSFALGAEYRAGAWHPVARHNLAVSLTPRAEAAKRAGMSARIAAKLVVSLYSSLNAELEVAPYATYEIERTTSAPSTTLVKRVGVRGSAKLNAKLLGSNVASYEKTLFDVRRDL